MDELFNVENDPEELENLAGSHPALVNDLKEEVYTHQSAAEEKFLGTSAGRSKS